MLRQPVLVTPVIVNEVPHAAHHHLVDAPCHAAIMEDACPVTEMLLTAQR
jgi:hypothetical protein